MAQIMSGEDVPGPGVEPQRACHATGTEGPCWSRNLLTLSEPRAWALLEKNCSDG